MYARISSDEVNRLAAAVRRKVSSHGDLDEVASQPRSG